MTPDAITQAIKQSGGDLAEAAALLGTNRDALTARLKQIARDRDFLKRIEVGDIDPEATPEDETRERRIAAATEQVGTALDSLKEKAKKQVDGTVSTLSPMERAFLINYLAGESQVNAARIAGYASPEKQGSRIANTPKMRAAIDEVLTRQEMGKLELIARLSEQARNVQADYIMPDGTVDLPRMIADGKRYLIKGVTPSQWGDKVEFMPAFESQVQMAKYHGLSGPTGSENDPVYVGVKYITENRQP